MYGRGGPPTRDGYNGGGYDRRGPPAPSSRAPLRYDDLDEQPARGSRDTGRERGYDDRRGYDRRDEGRSYDRRGGADDYRHDSRDGGRRRSRSPPRRGGRDDYDSRDSYRRSRSPPRRRSRSPPAAASRYDASSSSRGPPPPPRSDGGGSARSHRDRDDRVPAPRGERREKERDATDRSKGSKEQTTNGRDRSVSTPLQADDAADVDAAEMARMMGFSGFETTHQKHVQDDLAAVAIKQPRTHRQYMNRKGGFNRPLDKIK